MDHNTDVMADHRQKTCIFSQNAIKSKKSATTRAWSAATNGVGGRGVCPAGVGGKTVGQPVEKS